jgi:hypothetical protein
VFEKRGKTLPRRDVIHLQRRGFALFHWLARTVQTAEAGASARLNEPPSVAIRDTHDKRRLKRRRQAVRPRRKARPYDGT